MEPSITRTTATEWHAHVDGRDVGRADQVTRLDGRTFVSVDSWDAAAVEALIARLVADLPAPLRTVVDADDPDQRERWAAAGFERDVQVHSFVIGTDTGSGDGSLAPPDVERLIRVTGRSVQPRITLLTDDPDQARPALATTLARLRAGGTTSAVLDVPEGERVTLALLAELGARRTGTTLELVRR